MNTIPYDDNTRWQASDLWRIRDGRVEIDDCDVPGGWMKSAYTVGGLLDAERSGMFVRVSPQPPVNAELLAALRTIDTMPVDGCSPSVIESMLRQAKSLAYAAISSADAQGAVG